MSKRPSVSVIIPTYNGTAFVRGALESVWAQTMPPLEILVVDDASTDGTPSFVASLIAESPVPLRCLQLAQNSGGPARPMNLGIAQARGEFIAILDQDDIWLPHKLQT